jgi:hypothetical protein
MILCSSLAVIMRAVQSNCTRGEGGVGGTEIRRGYRWEILEEDICGKT